MTIGTAIVVSIGIICATFLGVCIIGAVMNSKKTRTTNELTQTLTNELNRKLKESFKK